MADADLQFVVRIDKGQLEAELGSITSAINGNASAASKAEGAVDGLGRAHRNASGEVSNFKNSLESLGSSSGVLEKLAASFGSVGGAASESIGKVGGFADALGGLGAVSGPLLAITAAIGAIVGVVAFLGEAAKKAGEFQQAFAVLGNTVTNEGGNWKQLSGGVNEWLEAQERASTFSKGELLTGLQQLTAAGIKVGDAQQIERVAMDASAASGKPLSDIEQALISAAHGRATALVRLGVLTKDQIKDGTDMNTVLETMEGRYKNAAAAAADTFPGALKQLSNAFGELQEKIGTGLLDGLTSAVHVITDFVSNVQAEYARMQQATTEWIAQHKALFDSLKLIWAGLVATVRFYFDEVVAVIRIAWNLIGGLFSAAVDFITGDWGQLWTDVKATAIAIWGDITSSFGNFGSNMMAIAQWIADNIKGVFGGLGTAMADAMTGNYTAAIGAVTSIHLTALPRMKSWLGGDATDAIFGHHAAKDTKPNLSGVDPHLSDDTKIGGHTAGAGSHHHKKSGSGAKAEYNFKDITDALTPAKQAVDALDASLKKLPQTIDGYDQAIGKLQPAIASETKDHDALSAKLAIAGNAYETARKHANDYGNTLQGHTNITAQQKEHLKELTDAVTEADKHYNAIKKTLDTVNATLVKHQQELDNAKKAIKALSDSWNTFEQNEQDRMKEDLATFQMTNAQKATYYQQLADQIIVIDKDTEKQKEGLQKKADDSYQASLKDQLTAVQNFAKSAQSAIGTFLNDIIIQHKSLADVLKGIYDQILQAFISMVARMIVESSLFKSIFGALGLSSLVGGSSIAATISGTVASTVTGAGTTELGTSTIKALTGSPTGVSGFGSGATATIINPVTILAAAAGIGGLIGSMEGAGTGAQQTHAINGAIGGVLGGVGGGLGALMLGLGGGAFGGLGAGLSMFTPLGWGLLAAGILGGSLLGGAIGPHWAPGSYPDRDPNTQNQWGQFIADFQSQQQIANDPSGTGHIIANGQQYSQDQPTAQQTNGSGIGQYLHDKLAGMSSAQINSLFGKDGPAIQAMFSQWDSRGLHDGKDGNLMIGNSTYSWNNINQLGTEAMNGLGTQGATGTGGDPLNVPVFSLVRSQPNYNNGMMTAIGNMTNGTFTPSTPTTPGTTSPGMNANPPITIIVQGGTFIGPGGEAQFVQRIQDQITKNYRMNYGNTRFGQN